MRNIKEQIKVLCFADLVFALLPQLGEHLLVHLAGLALLLLSLLAVFEALHLTAPHTGQLAVGGRQVAVTGLCLLVLLFEVFHQFLLEYRVAERKEEVM